MAVFLRDVAVGTLQQLYQGSKCNFTTSMEMLNEEHAVAAPSSSFDAAEKRNKKKENERERESLRTHKEKGGTRKLGHSFIIFFFLQAKVSK